jgi:hypothetical protein
MTAARSGFRTEARARPPAAPAASVGNLESYSFVVAEDQPVESGAEFGQDRAQTQQWVPLLGHDPWQGTLWEGYCSQKMAFPMCGHRFSCPPCVGRRQACTPTLFQQIDTALHCLFHGSRCSTCGRSSLLELLGICPANGHSKTRCHCHSSPRCLAGGPKDESVSTPPPWKPSPKKEESVPVQPLPPAEIESEGIAESENNSQEDSNRVFDPPSVSDEKGTSPPTIPQNVVPKRAAPPVSTNPGRNKIRIGPVNREAKRDPRLDVYLPLSRLQTPESHTRTASLRIILR